MAKKVEINPDDDNIVKLLLTGPVSLDDGRQLSANLNCLVASQNSLLGHAATKEEHKISAKTNQVPNQ